MEHKIITLWDKGLDSSFLSFCEIRYASTLSLVSFGNKLQTPLTPTNTLGV